MEELIDSSCGDELVSKLTELLVSGERSREKSLFLVAVFRGLADQIEASLVEDKPSRKEEAPETVRVLSCEGACAGRESLWLN